MHACYVNHDAKKTMRHGRSSLIWPLEQRQTRYGVSDETLVRNVDNPGKDACSKDLRREELETGGTLKRRDLSGG